MRLNNLAYNSPPQAYSPQMFAVSRLPLSRRMYVHLVKLNKILALGSIIGFLGSGVGYFYLLNLETKLDAHYAKITNAVHLRQDLYNMLGESQSWSSLDKQAKQYGLKNVKTIKVSHQPYSLAHTLSD